jgi:hypothetical protein
MSRAAPGALAPILVAAALAAACSSDAPLAPTRSASLLIEYRQPQIPLPDPPGVDLAMCFHHSAPANLSVRTSWGAEGRLTELGSDARTFGGIFKDVPVDQPLWIAITDIEFCKEGLPLVTRGVRANGVDLRAIIETSGGGRALGFSISPSGVVTP